MAFEKKHENISEELNSSSSRLKQLKRNLKSDSLVQKCADSATVPGRTNPILNDKAAQSFVWKFFVRDGIFGRCNIGKCNKLLVAKSGTSSLRKHLKSVHNITDPRFQSQHADNSLQETSHDSEVINFFY